MTVAEMIEKLQTMPQDAQVHHFSMGSWLDKDLNSVNVSDIKSPHYLINEAGDLYDVDYIEHKTVYCWSVRRGRYEPFTGVMIETGKI